MKLSFYNWENWISEKLNYLLKVNPTSWWQSQDWNLNTCIVSALSIFNRIVVKQASTWQVIIHNFCIYFGSWICAVLFSVHFFFWGIYIWSIFKKSLYASIMRREKKKPYYTFFPIHNPNFKCINFAECHGNIHICFSVHERYFGNYWLLHAWVFSSFSYRNTLCILFILYLCFYSEWE